MNAISIRNAAKHYKGFTLGGITLDIPQGCVTGLIGENGAGKSTLLRLITRVAHPDEGSISLLDSDIRPLDEVFQEIGVVWDEGCFPSSITPIQLGKVLSGLYRGWKPDVYEQYLDRFDLPRHKGFGKFSRGMKMKLAIAAALSHGAKLLILDEATSGLDPIVRDEILDLLYDFMQDETHTILISSHIISDLERLCDYIAFLYKGQLLFCEEKDVLLERYVLIRGSEEWLDSLDPEAIIRRRTGNFGTEALALRTRLPQNTPYERASLETIMVYLGKEDFQ
ncbi:MAG: ABC transporter ATP-binding protein [Butyricicoccaceae bacterium]